MYTEDEIKDAIKVANALIIKSDYSTKQEEFKQSLLALVCITMSQVSK